MDFPFEQMQRDIERALRAPETVPAKPMRKAPACKKCGRQIAFKKLASGKIAPVNLDGSEHWGDCAKARRGGRAFDPARDMKSYGITGANVVTVPVTEGDPPWEI
jgi:hypothetical protein